MLRNDMSPVKLPQLIKQFMFMFAGIHITQLSSLKYAKMGSLLCDVTVTLKRQGKIESIFFLKQDTFVYKQIYV